MRSPESFEKEKIDKFLKTTSCWFFKPFMKGFGKNGVPDVVICMPVTITQEMVGMRLGVFASVEVKREGVKPTPIQLRRMQEIVGAAGHPFWGTADVVVSAFKQAFGV